LSAAERNSNLWTISLKIFSSKATRTWTGWIGNWSNSSLTLPPKNCWAAFFRTIHTIKGSCGFLGFARLEKLAHAGESLLSRLRDGKLTLSEDLTSALLVTVDAIRQMRAAIQASGQDGEEDYASLIARLARLQGETEQPQQPSVSASAQVAPLPDSAPTVPEAKLADPSKIGGLLLERGQVRPEDLALALEKQEAGRKRIGEILIEQGAAKPEDVMAAQQILEARNPEAVVETIRVGVNLLDRLMNLVGELVLARNQLLQFSNGTQDGGFQAVSQRMNLIATELQEEVMKTRMQPIGNVWNKFPRTVRDLAISCGKDVRLDMEGRTPNSTAPSSRRSKILSPTWSATASTMALSLPRRANRPAKP
jgi:two-component system chemotaxis sensor kinase CheA